jgi:protein subunit release factor A
MRLDPSHLYVEVVYDRPRGMHVGNGYSCWVTVTHLPTMALVRVYHESQIIAREVAMQLLDLAVSEAKQEKCNIPEAIVGSGTR